MDKLQRGLILDFDGVMVDTERLHYESWQQAFDTLLGVRITGGHKQLVGLTLSEIYALWLGQAQVTSLAPSLKQALLEYKTAVYYERGQDLLQPIAGAVELAREAYRQGWYVAIASRSLRLRLLRTLEMVGIPAIFDMIMGSEDVVDSVTDRKVHARVAERLGIAPADCVVVEDSASGVRDAVACGIGCVVGLTTSLDEITLTQAGAKHVVGSLFDVMPLLGLAYKVV